MLIKAEIYGWKVNLYKHLWLCQSNFTVFLGKIDNTTLCLKEKYYKNEWFLRLVTHIFTKLKQNVCLINTHIFIYQNARCDCMLWKAIWFYCIFCLFSYIIDGHAYLKYYISTKVSLCLINTYIFICWHVRCNCKLRKSFWFNWFLPYGFYPMWFMVTSV